MQLNREQQEILIHTATRAARGCYCGDSPDMQALVAGGLMKSAGRVSFAPDEYFRLTGAGSEVVRSLQPNGIGDSLTPQEKTNGQ